MAEKLKKSSDDGNNYREAQPAEAALRQDEDNRLRRQLSRTMTQPRGMYEAMLDTLGPMAAPYDLEEDAAAIDEAYNRLQASLSSDTQTCNSHKDGQEIHPDPVHEEDGHGVADSLRQSSRTQNSVVEGRTDEEWAKDILRRPTGWGFVQRSQVTKYRTQLETNYSELQMEISNLSSKVGLLDNHIWFLRAENDTMKRKMKDLVVSQLFQEDQKTALERDLQQLRMLADGIEEGQQSKQDRDRADDTERSEQEQQDTMLSSISRLSVGQGDDAEARADLPTFQGHFSDQTVPNIQTREWLEGLPSVSTELSREANTGSNPSSSLSSEKEPEADGDDSRQLKLVKWPSSLYRSVSAIRKDVLEAEAEAKESE